MSSADQLVIGQVGQDVRVQPTVREPLGEIAERADLPPGEPGLAELGGIDCEQFGRCREMSLEQGLDARQGPTGRGDGQLLTGDLEQQRTVEIHRWQLRHPRPWIEVRAVLDDPRQHGVGVTEMGTRVLQPRGAVGILGHAARSLRPVRCHRATLSWVSPTIVVDADGDITGLACDVRRLLGEAHPALAMLRFRTELADLDEFEAERLDVSQYAVECRPIQEAGEYGLGALPP